MDNYVESQKAEAAFDLGNWHPNCVGVQLHINAATGIPWLFCPVCRCTAQVDVVSPHITPASSRSPREVVAND